MLAVFVHGLPETSRIWDSLRRTLDRGSLALALPGFGTHRPAGFTATKDAYAEWLADHLRGMEEPVDLVGHDVGALLDGRGPRGGSPGLANLLGLAPAVAPSAGPLRIRVARAGAF
jgi:pimeloyl-ACP methyl ester carboxylesterase